MDRSWLRTIYPCRWTSPAPLGFWEPRGIKLQEIYQPVLQVPFTIGLGDRKKCLLHGFHGLPKSVSDDEPA